MIHYYQRDFLQVEFKMGHEQLAKQLYIYIYSNILTYDHIDPSTAYVSPDKI